MELEALHGWDGVALGVHIYRHCAQADLRRNGCTSIAREWKEISSLAIKTLLVMRR